MDVELFNDLATLSIYHYVDVATKKKAKEAAERLFDKEKIDSDDFDDRENGETAYSQYEKMVVEYAEDNLTKDYKLCHDFYGAKCFSDDRGWNAPKTGLFSGDSHGQIMFFENFEAMEQYTKEKVACLV